MNYKDVITKNYDRQKNIITALCQARDTFDDKSIEYNFLQGIVSGLSKMRTQFETDFEKAQIEELKNNLNK